MILAALPIKPFGVAKARLSPVLGPATRSLVGRAIGARTAALAVEAGADVVVVTSDEGVAAWAKENDLGVLREDPRLGGGLNGAAATAAQHAAGLGIRWIIIHADLPVATLDDMSGVFSATGEGPVIVPSYDGGTNLISGEGLFPFSYGPASFHRHLAARPNTRVIATAHLALDLDTPADLVRARSSMAGAWLEDLVGNSDATSRS